MEFAQPPPNLSIPPPNIGAQGNPLGPPPMHGGFGQKFDPRMGFNNRPPFRPFLNLQRPLPGPLGNMTLEDFDGKRLRKSVMRKTVDYNSAIIKTLEYRVWQRDYRDRRALQPDVMYYPDMMPPPSYPDNSINCVTTRFVKTATNKMRCPIFCMAWTPEGRRLVTGASSGEFTLWNGLTFNFETILQAHDSPVRCMVWSHNDSWMVTGDHAGYVKYWQSNMNNVKMFQAHKEALRGISFSPLDSKFVTCSDDGTLRIWDFLRYQEERILRGHGADVKCVHWHPQKGLIISGSKDNQQPIKLWDPKSGQSLATLHAHKSTVMDLKWNDNGNWLITASRDHLLKLFDLRNLSQEVQTFRGHKKEASSVAWHPTHEGLFCSGGSDGSIMFWHVGADKEVGAIEQAHDSIVWTLAWHPLGHILCSGSNDHTSKFWTRNRPGDLMRDKYNLNTLPAGIAGLEDVDMDEPSIIPGMGPDDKVEFSLSSDTTTAIPGLDLDLLSADDKSKAKKVPYSKPIPRNFQAQWNETAGAEEDTTGALNEVISQIVENTPGVVPLQKIEPNAIIIYGKIIPVESGSKLEAAIAEGPEALNKFINSGQIPELADVMPHGEDNDYLNEAYIDDEMNNANLGSQRPVAFANPLLNQNNQVNLANQVHKAPAQGFLGDVDNRIPPLLRFGDNDVDSRHMDQDMRQINNSFNFARDNDMRNLGDVDLRNVRSEDIDFRNQRDFDMRNINAETGDEDYRMPYNRDQDFRSNRYEEEEEYDEEYVEDEYEGSRNWKKGGKFGQNQYGGPRNFSPNGHNFQGYRPQASNFNRNDGTGPNQFRPQEGQNWNGPPMGEGFRGRNNYRGSRGVRGSQRGFGGPRGGSWGPRGGPAPRGAQPSRSGGPPRGQPNRGRSKY